MASSDSDFMREARFQDVPWRSWGTEALLESRRTGKPIFLVAGSTWGELREVYDVLFSVEEISEYLKQEFVCIRVDTLVNPEWRSTPAPIVRSLRPDARDFFIGIFTADGRVVDIPSKEVLMEKNDVTFLAYLRTQLEVFGTRNETELHRESASEVVDMRGGVSSGLSDGTKYVSTILDRLDGAKRLVPNELEFLLDAGEIAAVKRVVDRYLSTGIADIVWGGFFGTWDGNYDEIRYVKSSFSNAGMLRVLSRLAAETGDPVYVGAARWQFDYVRERFGGELSTSGDFVRLGDARRSIIYSFPNSRLRGLLTREEVELARSGLGLRPGENPQALARFVDRRDWETGGRRFEPILEKLRGGVAEPESAFGGTTSYEAQADAVHALLLASRLLNEGVRQGEAIEAFEELRERMRIGLDDVVAGPRDQVLIEAGLGTSISYVGAAWEAMLLTGEEEIGWDGARVLQRALFLYRDDQNSLWSGSIDAMDQDWRHIIPPPVMDGSGRAAMAEVIRLCDLYGNWQGSKSLRGELLRGRDRAANQVSWILEECGAGFGSLGRAVRQVDRGTAIGYQGEIDWAYFEREYPGVPLIPIFDESGGDGYRVMRKGNWMGPFPLNELGILIR